MPHSVFMIVVVIVAVFMGVNWPRGGSLVMHVSDIEDKAALSIMVEAVSPHVSKYAIANGWDNQRSIDANQLSLDKFKEYVASVSDPGQRSALERWVRVEQRSIDEARTELRTGAVKAENEMRRKKYDEENQQRDQAMKLFPAPPR